MMGKGAEMCSTMLSSMSACSRAKLVPMLRTHKGMTHVQGTRTKNSRELTRASEKLVRVSYRLAARYFSREFLASNRARSISCEFLVRVLVRVSRTSFSCVCHGLELT